MYIETKEVPAQIESGYDLLKLLATLPIETQEHCRRVGVYFKILWELLYGKENAVEMGILAQMHDIGKVFIPRRILRKPEKLELSEYEIVKMHTEYAADLFNAKAKITYGGLFLTDEFKILLWEVSCFHHERWDGKGYARGLVKDQIPISARICAVVDAYDVMTAGRPYQEKVSVCEACQELIANAGTQFDPMVVRMFMANRFRFEE